MSAILSDRDADVGEEAAAVLGVVCATRSGGNGERLVGIVAVAEPASEAAGFKVAVLRVVGALDDDIGATLLE